MPDFYTDISELDKLFESISSGDQRMVNKVLQHLRVQDDQLDQTRKSVEDRFGSHDRVLDTLLQRLDRQDSALAAQQALLIEQSRLITRLLDERVAPVAPE